jgi:hypothetical protein
MKTKTLEVPVFKTPDGAPTCAFNFKTGDFCMFLRSQRFGLDDVCAITQSKIFRGDSPKGPEMGYLIPRPECPLHNQKK